MPCKKGCPTSFGICLKATRNLGHHRERQTSVLLMCSAPNGNRMPLFSYQNKIGFLLHARFHFSLWLFRMGAVDATGSSQSWCSLVWCGMDGQCGVLCSFVLVITTSDRMSGPFYLARTRVFKDKLGNKNSGLFLPLELFLCRSRGDLQKLRRSTITRGLNR